MIVDTSHVDSAGFFSHCTVRLAKIMGYFLETGKIPNGVDSSNNWKKYKDGRPSNETDKNEHSHVGEANQYGDQYYERGGRRKAENRERALQSPPPERNAYASPR